MISLFQSKLGAKLLANLVLPKKALLVARGLGIVIGDHAKLKVKSGRLQWISEAILNTVDPHFSGTYEVQDKSI